MIIYTSEEALKKERFLPNEFMYNNHHYTYVKKNILQDTTIMIYKTFAGAREHSLSLFLNDKRQIYKITEGE